MNRLRATEMYKDAERLLLVVESVTLEHGCSPSGTHLFGAVEPVAVVVSSGGRVYALNMKARTVNVDQLRRELPALESLLVAFNRRLD